MSVLARGCASHWGGAVALGLGFAPSACVSESLSPVSPMRTLTLSSRCVRPRWDESTCNRHPVRDSVWATGPGCVCTLMRWLPPFRAVALLTCWSSNGAGRWGQGQARWTGSLNPQIPVSEEPATSLPSQCTVGLRLQPRDSGFCGWAPVAPRCFSPSLPRRADQGLRPSSTQGGHFPDLFFPIKP